MENYKKINDIKNYAQELKSAKKPVRWAVPKNFDMLNPFNPFNPIHKVIRIDENISFVAENEKEYSLQTGDYLVVTDMNGIFGMHEKELSQKYNVRLPMKERDPLEKVTVVPEKIGNEFLDRYKMLADPKIKYSDNNYYVNRNAAEKAREEILLHEPGSTEKKAKALDNF